MMRLGNRRVQPISVWLKANFKKKKLIIFRKNKKKLKMVETMSIFIVFTTTTTELSSISATPLCSIHYPNPIPTPFRKNPSFFPPTSIILQFFDLFGGTFFFIYFFLLNPALVVTSCWLIVLTVVTRCNFILFWLFIRCLSVYLFLLMNWSFLGCGCVLINVLVFKHVFVVVVVVVVLPLMVCCVWVFCAESFDSVKMNFLGMCVCWLMCLCSSMGELFFVLWVFLVLEYSIGRILCGLYV